MVYWPVSIMLGFTPFYIPFLQWHIPAIARTNENQTWKSIIIPKMNVTIPCMLYLLCLVTYLAIVGFIGNALWPGSSTMYKLSGESHPKHWAYYSNLLGVRIALIAAVPFLHLGHGKSFNLITERAPTWLRKEFSLWSQNYQLQLTP